MILDLHYEEYYQLFFKDLRGLVIDSESLTKMLESRIKELMEDFERRGCNEETCHMIRKDVIRAIDSYSRLIETYCFKLQNNYTEAFYIILSKLNEEKNRCDIHPLDEKG